MHTCIKTSRVIFCLANLSVTNTLAYDEQMEPMQCRAARALLQWTQRELAQRASVSPVTVNLFEIGARAPTRATIIVLRQAFEREGIEFSTDGRGVRLK